MKSFALLLLLFSAYIPPIHSSKPLQPVEFSGIVVDATSGDILPNVTLWITELKQSFVTDINGSFHIKLEPATYEVHFNTVGYTSIIKKIVIPEDGLKNYRVLLHQSVIGLEEVILSPQDIQQPKQSLGYSQPQQTSFMLRGYAPIYESNTEEYDGIIENGFQFAQSNPLSTFSIDVDGASYSNIRRMIMDGQLPPVDAVRIEELINYFNYDYSNPVDGRPFTIHSEVAVAPWNSHHQLVQIGIKGEEIERNELLPDNLVFLLDVSGSMRSRDKLELLKKGFRLLVNELTEEDYVSIVVYAGASGLVLPPTSGVEKETILKAIDELQAGGSTAGAAGIELAYETAKHHFKEDANNRVILATDGDFNVGISSDTELIRLIEERRDDGIFLSVLGFGTGNLKDSKMEKIANHGNGNYYYIDNLLEAKKVLVTEMGGTLHTIAKDVKLQVEFNPNRVQAYRLIGYENRLLEDYEFNDDSKDAGELGSGHTVTALYEVVPVGVAFSPNQSAVDSLKYQTIEQSVNVNSDELMTVKVRYKLPNEDQSSRITHVINDTMQEADMSSDLSFSAALATFGMILRNSDHKGSSNFDLVFELAQNGMQNDPHGYRAEFLRIAELAELLYQGNSKLE